MSGSASTSVEVGLGIGGGGNEVGYGSYRAPFTALQWQELEQQAMIYKYMVAGLPVPPDLVTPIRRSYEALSARFFQHPSLGYCSYYGKKLDPEPGRCRRTDGKKWRCSKDSHPDSKYCERHMHRGRNRSRKPVESQNNTSQSSGSFQGSGNGGKSFQNIPSYSSVISSDSSPYGSSVAKLQMEPVSYGMDNNKEFRYIQGLTPEADDHSFSPEASTLGLTCNAGSGTWHLMPSQVSSSKSDSQLLGPTEQTMAHVFEPMNTSISRQRHQHCFLGSEIDSAGPTKHPFFSEWPMTKESWSALDEDDGPNKNVFSSTQLSISIPRGSSDFSSRSGYSPSDG